MDYKKFELVPETEKYINILNEEGNEELCQILFSVISEEYKKTFVVFSRVSDIERSYSEDGDDRIEVGAALFKEGENGEGELFQITEEEDWEIVSQAIAEFDEMYETLAEEHECCCHEHCHCDEENIFVSSLMKMVQKFVNANVIAIATAKKKMMRNVIAVVNITMNN